MVLLLQGSFFGPNAAVLTNIQLTIGVEKSPLAGRAGKRCGGQGLGFFGAAGFFAAGAAGLLAAGGAGLALAGGLGAVLGLAEALGLLGVRASASASLRAISQ